MTGLLQKRLDDRRRRAGAVGASIAVLRDGDVETAASGLLNLDTGMEATPDSLFQIGSITKVYTATLVMHLVARGGLAPEDKVVDVLPGFAVADSEATNQIRVEHLLSHTAGFDGDQFIDVGRGDDALERYAAACADLTQTTPVGSVFSYCNSGFAVLGRIVEHITGTSWDAALQEHLLRPLGLTHTVTLPEDALRHRVAVGHVDGSVGPRWELTRGLGPAGMIRASAADVVGFAAAFLDPSTPLEPSIVSSMLEPRVAVPGPQGGQIADEIGLGWMLRDGGNGLKVVGHDGATVGQSSRLRFVPGTGTAVAMLATGGSPQLLNDLVDELIAELTGATPPPLLKPRARSETVDLGQFAGRFERTSFAMDVRLEGEKLTFENHLNWALPVTYGGELAPYDVANGVFLLRHERLGPHWIPLIFLTLPDGTLAVHLAGRCTPAALTISSGG